MKTFEKEAEFFTKLFFTLVSLKYFCERAKAQNKKKIDIDFVLIVINEALNEK